MTNTTSATKITKVMALAFVLEHCDLPTEYKDKIQSMYDNESKPKTSKAQTAKKEANANLQGIIMEIFTQTPDLEIRASELPKLHPDFDGFSTSRCAYLLNGLVTEGHLVKDFVKRNTVFKLA